ncbi:alcohol dehydrogenase catalytic domain-containing protein [Georgenia halophila]|uniref:Alcohol dehydrogenase catalytic domain-containing protein n=1 Tax=Georgenia halophila TaxID=620889 RepID=A0ABP8LKN5_9MICO
MVAEHVATDPRPANDLPETMRAAVMFGPGDIRVVDKPVPRPGPGEVLVKVSVCGMCGTDLKIYDGHFPGTPPYGTYTPGHEWAGTVVEVGETVDEVETGDRVCIEAHHGCGRCENCMAGQYTACLNYGDVAKGHKASGMTVDGGFAEYAIHHVAALSKMPDNVSDLDAVLITTAGTGLFGIDMIGGYLLGKDVVIFGPGPVGLMTVQAAKQLGARRVILVGTRASRLAKGKDLGADHVIDANETDPVAEIRRLTGEGADVVIESSGNVRTPQQCVESVRRGGTILVVAFYPEPVTIDLAAVVRQGVQLHTTRGEGGNNVRRALALAEMGRLRGEELVTHEFPLEDIAEALRVVRERDGDPLKAVIRL